jgi:hypothetical protein
VKNYFFILLPIAFSAALYLPRRAKEISPEGRPLLRYFGPAVVLLCSATFWIVKIFQGMSSGEFDRYPDDLYVNYFVVGFSLVGGLWFLLGWKTTLTDEAIEHSMWPFPPLRYFFRDVISVKRGATMSLEFAKGRRFGALPFTSGRKFFVDSLDVRLKEIGK